MCSLRLVLVLNCFPQTSQGKVSRLGLWQIFWCDISPALVWKLLPHFNSRHGKASTFGGLIRWVLRWAAKRYLQFINFPQWSQLYFVWGTWDSEMWVLRLLKEVKLFPQTRHLKYSGFVWKSRWSTRAERCLNFREQHSKYPFWLCTSRWWLSASVNDSSSAPQRSQFMLTASKILWSSSWLRRR